MENSNLASLPLAILHLILRKIATHSIKDFGNARIALRRFNELGRDDYFYKVANVLYMNQWYNETEAVVTFLHKCYNAGNPEAIYLRGMHEFFFLHLVEEGREKIRLAGESGFELARFVDGMMNLAFSVDENGSVHNYPDFTRDYVDRMSHMLNDWKLGCCWDYVKPEKFLSVFQRLSCEKHFYCWCSKIEEPEVVVSIDGSSSNWRCYRCFWHDAAWEFCNSIHLRVNGWPTED